MPVVRFPDTCSHTTRPLTRIWRCSWLIIPIIFALVAHADGADAGKSKAETCAGCHGENGVSQTENTPSLASQPDGFLQWQLVFFRSGTRKNEVMGPIAEQLSNEDVRASAPTLLR